MGVGSAVKARKGEATGAVNQMGKAQDGIVEAKSNLSMAQNNYNASGAKKWSNFSNEEIHSKIAASNSVISERQERLQFLQGGGEGGDPRRIQAVQGQISDLKRDRSQMQNLLDYRSAQRKEEQKSKLEAGYS